MSTVGNEPLQSGADVLLCRSIAYGRFMSESGQSPKHGVRNLYILVVDDLPSKLPHFKPDRQERRRGYGPKIALTGLYDQVT